MHENGTLNPISVLNTLHQITSEKTVPLSIFQRKLYPLEALTYYLHKDQHLTFAEIGRTLHKNERSIWAAFQRSTQKKHYLLPISSPISIPLSIFTSTPSLQTSLILYLKNTHHLSTKKIASLLNTSPNSISTVAKRGNST